MEYSLILFLLLLPFYAMAQLNSNWQLTLQLQPELTIHKNYNWVRGETFWVTPNAGLASTLQKNLNENLFLEAGVGYISRRLQVSADFDYQTMFPGENMFAVEYTARNVSYKTLQFPVSLGINFFNSEEIRLFAKCTYVPNLVLGTKYKVQIGTFDPEKYFYSEDFWQGYSVNAGVGFDFMVNKKFSLTNTVSYTALNTVKRDLYTSYAYEKIALNYNSLQLSTGIKMNLN